MEKKTRLCIFQKLIKIKETRLSIYMLLCIHIYVYIHISGCIKYLPLKMPQKILFTPGNYHSMKVTAQ